MVTKFQKKCFKCKKNYVMVTGKQRFPICYECQKKELEGAISNPEMKKMFKIPEDFYKQNSFLRDIKIKYLKYGALTDKQIEAFKKTVKELKEGL